MFFKKSKPMQALAETLNRLLAGEADEMQALAAYPSVQACLE